jgi:hypothetical protein
MERARVQSFCVANLNEIFSHLDKGYCHAIVDQAIMLLINEINRLKEPAETVRKFRLMVENPFAVQPLLDFLDMGITSGSDVDEGELFQRYLERLLEKGL